MKAKEMNRTIKTTVAVVKSQKKLYVDLPV